MRKFWIGSNLALAMINIGFFCTTADWAHLLVGALNITVAVFNMKD